MGSNKQKKEMRRLTAIITIAVIALMMCMVILLVVVYMSSIGNNIFETETETEMETEASSISTEATTEGATPTYETGSEGNVVYITKTETTESEEPTVESVEVTNPPVENTSFNRFVMVGDSRYVGMSIFAVGGDKFFCENGCGYMYLESHLNEIVSSLVPGTALVMGLGINDCMDASLVYRYLAIVNNLADTVNVPIYIQLVAPVDEIKEAERGYYVTNAAINAYNQALLEGLSPKVRIIDLRNFIRENNFGTVDGIHYSGPVYSHLYNYLRTMAFAMA